MYHNKKVLPQNLLGIRDLKFKRLGRGLPGQQQLWYPFCIGPCTQPLHKLRDDMRGPTDTRTPHHRKKWGKGIDQIMQHTEPHRKQKEASSTSVGIQSRMDALDGTKRHH